MRERTEEAFFFEHEGSKLFAILHVPDPGDPRSVPRQSKGVVFCHPFAEEKALSHRVMVDFARFLCSNGYHVLRFDYRGCGDSEGDFEQATVTSRLSDIERAMGVFGERTGVTEPLLFGLRFGGTLAAMVAEANSRVHGMILWEPVVQVRIYLLQFLRMQVMAEKFREGKVRMTRDELLKELKEGRCVDVLGFMLGPGFFEECMGLDILKQRKTFSKPLLVVGVTRQRSYHTDLRSFIDSYPCENGYPTLMQVNDRPFWYDPNNVFRELASWFGHEILFQSTLEWMEGMG
jgi:exosortase A-associated hydrolase 2